MTDSADKKELANMTDLPTTMTTTLTTPTTLTRRIVRAQPYVKRSIVDTKLPIVHGQPPTRVEKRTRGDVPDGTSNKRTKEWQLCDNWEVRNYMRDLICMLLKEKRPDASKEWYDKIPKIAERLEEALYYASKEFADYANPSTLKARLQTMASSIKNNDNLSMLKERLQDMALSVRDNGNKAIQNPNTGSSSGSSGGSCSSSGSCSDTGISGIDISDISDIALILQNLHLEEEYTQDGMGAREEGMGAREEDESEDEEGDD